MKNNSKINMWKIALETVAIGYNNDSSNKDDKILSLKQWGISAAVSIVLAIMISYSNQTINYMQQITNLIKDISIAFLAMIIGAFALYQALLSGKVIALLYERNNIFEELNNSWLGIIMLFLFEIIIDFILMCFLFVLPNDFMIFKNNNESNFLAAILIFVFLCYTIRIFIEVRNFINNLYKMFQVYNKIKLLEEIEKEKKKENKN